MKLYAKNIMNPHVITAHPETTSAELMELLVMNRISGVPVVNKHGHLMGVISMTDIIKSGLDVSGSSRYFEEAQLDKLLAEEGFHIESTDGGYVADYMSPTVWTAFPHTLVEDLAKLMMEHHIHRVIIVSPDDQTPIGIVTSFDLLRLIATADELEKCYDECSNWYAKKFSQVPYETLPTLQ